jgi:hypothetical protein
VEDAAKSADLTEISAMLMVRLNAIHNALDTVELGHANPDPEMAKLIEAVRRVLRRASGQGAPRTVCH